MCFNSAIKASGMHLSRRTYVVTFWPCLHQKNATSFSYLQRRFDLNMKTHFKTTRRVKTSGMHLSRRTYVPLFSKPLRNIRFSPTSHLLALSTAEKHYKFFGFTKTDLNTKTHFKTTRGEGLRVPSRTTAEIHYLPLTAFHLVANDILQ